MNCGWKGDKFHLEVHADVRLRIFWLIFCQRYQNFSYRALFCPFLLLKFSCPRLHSAQFRQKADGSFKSKLNSCNNKCDFSWSDQIFWLHISYKVMIILLGYICQIQDLERFEEDVIIFQLLYTFAYYSLDKGVI